jgi:hypothetical protein
MEKGMLKRLSKSIQCGNYLTNRLVKFKLESLPSSLAKDKLMMINLDV